MSKYSGKCDFRDSLEINFEDNWENFKNRATVYHYVNENGEKELLTFNSPADLIPWYTHIIASGAFEKDGPCTIVLSRQDYLDEKLNSFKMHNLDYSYTEERKKIINELYKKEKLKSYEDQRII